MKKLISILVLAISTIVIAQEANKAKDVENKKVYSEKEFQEALVKEVELKLKRLKQNEIVEYSKELLKKEYDLKIKEKEFDNRELKLSENTTLLEKKMGEFREQQNRFLACLQKTDKAEEGRVNHMVDALSGMKPDAAAKVLSVQDPGIAVKMISKLDSTKVSKIFNKMDKEVSARLQKQFLTMQK